MSKGHIKYLTIDGVTKSMKEWSVVEGARTYYVIRDRLINGWDPKSAVFGEKRIIEKMENVEVKITALSKSWRDIAKYPITDLSENWAKNRV